MKKLNLKLTVGGRIRGPKKSACKIDGPQGRQAPSDPHSSKRK